MKSFIKIFLLFFSCFGIVFLTNRLDKYTNMISGKITICLFYLFMLGFSLLIWQEKSVNLFSSISDSDFKSKIGLENFISKHLLYTFIIFLVAMLFQVVLIVIPSFNTKIYFDILVLGVSICIYSLLFFKIYKYYSQFT